MKSYPSIPTKIDFNKEYIAFDKLDGSNIRAEWSKKKGFYKFGSRTQLLSETQTMLYPSIEIIRDKYEEEITKKCLELEYERVVCFFEYLGPNSFAGSHTDPIESMDAILIDLNPYKKGILPPEEFLKITQNMDTPRVLYRGTVDEDFIEKVRDNRLLGLSGEGVVLKAIGEKHHTMAKVKTREWLDRLREYCDNDPKLFNRLK